MDETNTVTHEKATLNFVMSEDRTDVMGSGVKNSDLTSLHISRAAYMSTQLTGRCTQILPLTSDEGVNFPSESIFGFNF